MRRNLSRNWLYGVKGRSGASQMACGLPSGARSSTCWSRRSSCGHKGGDEGISVFHHAGVNALLKEGIGWYWYVLVRESVFPFQEGVLLACNIINIDMSCGRQTLS